MPHLTIEHSANLADSHDMQALCQALFDKLAPMDEVPKPENLKIRTLPCPAWVTGAEPQSFAHAMLMALPGRSDAQKLALTSAVLDVMMQHLPKVTNLSADLCEMSPAYIKPPA